MYMLRVCVPTGSGQALNGTVLLEKCLIILCSENQAVCAKARHIFVLSLFSLQGLSYTAGGGED